MAQTDFPAVIIEMVSKEQIARKDTGPVVACITRKVNQFLELENEIKDMSVEQKIRNGVALFQRTSRIRFGISGSDNLPQPLWYFPEIKSWAWTWLREQPYCILFLEEQYSLLLSLLCLGGRNSDKFGGFIPDFTSDKASEFKSLLIDSIGVLFVKYDNPWLLGAFALSKHSSLVPQFQEMEKESL
ncbi:hypothetical protein EPO44_10655 [bacterium]|nr:MAG: hypothetical protein EPO44_10655 [bacterium]